MRGLGGVTMLAAALVFGVSAVVFGATVVDALRVDESSVAPEALASPDVTGDASAGGGALSSSAPAGPEGAAPNTLGPEGTNEQRPLQGIVYPRVTGTEILAAVNQDLFQPDRTPSLTPYLLPSERPAPVQESRNNRRQREPSLRVVGTAIMGDRALALIQTEDSLPVVYLLGDMVDGFTLATVNKESVTLAAADGTEFNFPVTEPDRGRQSNNNNNQGRNARGQNTNNAQAIQQQLQQAIRGLNLQGGQMMFQRQGAVPGQGGVAVPPGAVIFQGAGQAGGGAAVLLRGRGGGRGGGS